MRLLAAAARSGARDAGSSDRGARAPAEDDARRDVFTLLDAAQRISPDDISNQMGMLAAALGTVVAAADRSLSMEPRLRGSNATWWTKDGAMASSIEVIRQWADLAEEFMAGRERRS